MGDLSPDFTWHETAKLWQTPGQGEEFMAGVAAATLADRAALLMAVGVPESGATAMAEGFDETMGAAILTLYRSATDVGNEWGPGIDSIRGPGLLIESMQDPFRSAGRVRRLADRTGATIVSLPDAGHFWMLESPARAAEILTGFWASI
jgi:pimeloyl-ACP methyl ester carboxylesterase